MPTSDRYGARGRDRRWDASPFLRPVGCVPPIDSGQDRKLVPPPPCAGLEGGGNGGREGERAPCDAARDAQPRGAGRRREAHRAAARAREAHRARAARAPPRRGIVPGVRRARHARRHRVRPGRAALPGRRSRHRLRQDQRAPRRRLRAGLHRPRRVVLRGAVEQDLPHSGPRARKRHSAHRPERLGRRAHPGGRPRPRRLRRGVRAQRDGLGRHPADLADPRAVRRRRGLLARADRFRDHGRAARASCSSPAPT